MSRNFAVIKGPATRPQLEAKRRLIMAMCEEAGSRFVRFTFIKKDGTVRDLTTCNTATVGIKGEAASEPARRAVETSKANNPNLIRRYDVRAKGWRSINLDTVTEMQVEGNRVQFHNGPWTYAAVTGRLNPAKG